MQIGRSCVCGYEMTGLFGYLNWGFQFLRRMVEILSGQHLSKREHRYSGCFTGLIKHDFYGLRMPQEDTVTTEQTDPVCGLKRNASTDMVR